MARPWRGQRHDSCLLGPWHWCHPRSPTTILLAILFTVCAAPTMAGPRYSSRIVDTQSGPIRGIIVEPASRQLEPVEVFLGVPFASQPQRLSPPPPPARWTGTKLADNYGPVCPQVYPDIANRTSALENMPLGKYNQLKRVVPLLANQSEDCLYLNIFVPGSGARGMEAPYAVMVWLPGGSFDWGTGNEIDGSVLASYSHIIVVAVNIRLGLLGFLPVTDSTIDGNCFALQDAVAALQWTRRNIASFGGDPTRVTVAGHDTGAALASFLLVDNRTKDLVHRAILMSGSALSPWAVSHDPVAVRVATAKQLGCSHDDPADVNEEDSAASLASCVRSRPLAALLRVTPPAPRFRSAWAPAAGAAANVATARALDASSAFLTARLMVGVATTESYTDFSDIDIQYGFEEEYRNRILRTYIRNTYVYHLNEIFAAVRNEYTDWDKPVQHPINIRDSTLEALSDASTAAPSLHLAHLHARRGAPTFFFHFHYQTKESDFPQRLGSVRGEAFPYLLGEPLVAGLHNYSRQDLATAETLQTLLAAFVKGGDPGMAASSSSPDASHTDPPSYPDYGRERARYRGPAWTPYEPTTQQYLSLGTKPRIRSHYRGHKMALWLNLIPQLHRPGNGDVSTRHHHFRERDPHFYIGSLRPESFTILYRAHQIMTELEEDLEDAVSLEDECEPAVSGTAVQVEVLLPSEKEADLLQTLVNKNYSYTIALGVTVAIGCFLLFLNVMIFVGIYYQRRLQARRQANRSSGNSAYEDAEKRPRRSKRDHLEDAQFSQGGSILDQGTSSYTVDKNIKICESSLSYRIKQHPDMRTEQNSALHMENFSEIPAPFSESRETDTLKSLKKRVQIQEISV